ncbi:MAG TPA: PilZ domain-containing protein [Novosphingobium sp.]|nr:PilZ domain-containing protein [Novosphingobium sp.]
MSHLDGKIVAADDCAREPRQRRLIRARMFNDRLPGVDIIIRNISGRGIGAASRGLPPVKGEKLSILLPHHEEVTGLVRWVDNLSFGFELDLDLDLQALRDAIQRQIGMDSASKDWEVRRLHRGVAKSVDPSTFRRI